MLRRTARSIQGPASAFTVLTHGPVKRLCKSLARRSRAVQLPLSTAETQAGWKPRRPRRVALYTCCAPAARRLRAAPACVTPFRRCPARRAAPDRRPAPPRARAASCAARGGGGRLLRALRPAAGASGDLAQSHTCQRSALHPCRCPRRSDACCRRRCSRRLLPAARRASRPRRCAQLPRRTGTVALGQQTATSMQQRPPGMPSCARYLRMLAWAWASVVPSARPLRAASRAGHLGRRARDSRPLAATQAAAAPCSAPAAPQRGAVTSSPRTAAGVCAAAPAAVSAPLQLVTPRASPPPAATAATPSLAEGLAAPAPRRLSASAGAPGVMMAAASPFASFAAPPPQQHAPPPLALGAPRHAAPGVAAAASGFVRWHGAATAAPAQRHSAPSSGGSGGGGSGGEDDDAIAAELLVLRASSPRHDMSAGGAHPTPSAGHHAHSGLAGTPRRKRAAPDPSKFRGVVERTVRHGFACSVCCFGFALTPSCIASPGRSVPRARVPQQGVHAVGRAVRNAGRGAWALAAHPYSFRIRSLSFLTLSSGGC